MLHRPTARRPAARGVGSLLAGIALIAAGGVAAAAFGLGALRTGPAPSAAQAASAQAASNQAASNQAASEQAASNPQPAAGASALELARAHTVDVPQDPGGWAALALTALEAGRATADPERYAEARAAADRSLALQPDDNDLALAARAALSNAEHDFATGREQARQALAVNPRSAVALAALTDALTELGRADEALAAAHRLDSSRPGVASFTRLSYQAELRGETAQARALMVRAARDATTPAQIAFARAQEGLLALSAGDVPGARAALTAGLGVAPDDVTLAHLGARLAVAQDDLAGAVMAYAALVARRPSAAYAGEQAELLTAAGDPRGAGTALDIARAGYRLQADAGIRPEGTQVLFEADHGDPATAVRLGRETWGRSPTTPNADALGWALHAAGDDRAALAFATRALALGGRPAGFLYHRGAIRAALGDRAGAVADLRAALAGRPHFSPVDAPAARRLLATLEARS